MIIKFNCINISSLHPEAFVEKFRIKIALFLPASKTNS